MKKAVALTLAASALFLAGCCTTPHHAKWEYKQVEMATEADLNQLADQGWSIVAVTSSTRGAPLYILKRAKQ